MKALNLVGERRQVPIYIPSKRGFSFGGNPGVVCNGKFVYPVAVGSLTGEAAVHILEDGKQVCPGLLSLNLMRNLGISLELSEREASVWNQNTYEYEPLEVLGRSNDHMYLDLFSGLSSEGVEPWTEEQLDVWVGRSQIPKEEFRFGPALWTYEEYKQRWKNPASR